MTRSRGRRKVRLLLVGVVLLGGILAVAAGYFLGSYAMQALVIGVDNGQDQAEPPDDTRPRLDPEPVEPEPTQLAIRFPVLTLYRAQVGAFSSRDNALTLASDLRRQGFTPYVSTDEPYRVVVAVASDRDSLAVVADEMDEHGLPVFVSQWQLPAGTVTVEGEQAYLDWLADTVASLHKSISGQALVWSGLLTGQSPDSSTLDELETGIRQLNTEAGARSPAGDVADHHKQLSSLLEASVRSVFELRALVSASAADDWQSGMALFLEVVGGYEEFVRRLGAG